MRLLVLIAALSLATTALAFVPTGAAVGTCTEFTDSRCPYTACVGYSWSYPDPYYDCQYWVDRDPCSYISCWPGPYLP